MSFVILLYQGMEITVFRPHTPAQSYGRNFCNVNVEVFDS